MEPQPAAPPIEALLAHRPWLRRLARTIARDDARADDLEQEVWLAALDRPPPRGTSLRGWLATVLRRRASNQRRAEGRRGAHERLGARPEAAPLEADLVIEAEEARRVTEALLALEEPYRSTLLLRFHGELDPAAIAARHGVPVETVRTRVRRGLERLRTVLGAGDPGRRSALALLARNPTPDAQVHHPSTPAASGTLAGGAVAAIAGGILMTTRTKAVLATVALLLLIAAMLWNRQAVPPAVDHADAGASAGGPGRVAVPRASPITQGTADIDNVAPATDPPEPPPSTETNPPVAAARVAVLEIRVLDASTNEHLREFSCSVEGASYIHASGTGGLLRVDFPLGDGELPGRARVRLTTPETAKPVVKNVEGLQPGVTESVLLVWRSSEEMRGRVVDAEGNPLAGALIFFGPLTRMRGDEPYKPFREDRIKDGARSTDDGTFIVRGDGAMLTVWHEHHSPVTVPLENAAEIRLPPRASLHGRILDGSGAPVAAAELTIDSTRRTTTDAEGRFRFDGLEAGVRALRLPDRRTITVRLQPGEERELEVGPGVHRVQVRIVSGGAPLGGIAGGAVVPRGEVGSIHQFRVADSAAELENVLPGNYLVFLIPGRMARMTVDGPDAEADCGTAKLQVAAAPGAVIQIIPAGVDDATETIALRVLRFPVPADGTLDLGPLPAGTYRVLQGEEEQTVDLAAGETARVEFAQPR